MRPLGIYVHIPFCVRRCPYCGFYSNACGRSGYEDDISEYFDLLEKELDIRAGQAGAPYFVDSVYFGGGTPSLAAPELFDKLLDRIAGRFTMAEDPEISMEANPGTLTEERLKGYRKAGVNRLSIGLQSFDEGVLRTLGRIHTAYDFVRSYEDARKAGFDNISADLMFGIPGQTQKIWEDTVVRTASMLPEHVSFYSLQIEEGTRFYRDYKMGDMIPVTDEEDRAMYHSAIRILKDRGYSQFMGGVRRTDRAEEYDGYITQGMPDEMLAENHVNSEFDNASDYMITGLRLTEGVKTAEFRALFGKTVWDMFPGAKDELCEFFDSGCLKEEDGRIYITEKGLDISNRIMSCFV